MTLDIQSLKSEYIKYMKSKGKPVENGEVDIFSTSFRNFLSTQDDIDVNRIGLNVQDLVDTLDETENIDVMAALQEAKDSFESEEASNVIDFLSVMMEDEEFTSKIDADGKNGVDKSELVTFLTSISREDKDGKDITLRDLIDGGKKTQSENFEMPKVKDWDEIVESKGSKKASETESSSSASGSGSAGGSGGVSGGGGNTTTQNTNEEKEVNAITEAAKSYEGKTVPELEQEKEDQQAEFDKQNTAMQEAIAGNSQKVADLKTSMDTAYSAFLEASGLSEEQAAQIEDQRATVQETEVAYNQAYVEKDDMVMQKQGTEMQIASVEQSIATVDGSITAVNNTISTLQAAASNVKEGEVNTYASQIAALQAQVAQLTQQKTDLETQKKNLETEKTEQETKITELETKLTELQETYTQQSEALAQAEIGLIQALEITDEASKAAAEAYNQYDQAKVTYEAKNNEIRDTARAATQTARANIEAIDNQLIIAQREESQAEFMQFATDFDNGLYDNYKEGDDLSLYSSKPKQDTTAQDATSQTSQTNNEEQTVQNEDEDEKDEDE